MKRQEGEGKSFLVIDSGLYLSLAEALSENGKNKVWYYTNTGTAFPSYKEFAAGNKFGHVEKVKSFWDYVEKADGVINFDVGANDAIEYIRKKYPEKCVVGAGKCERFEMDRIFFKKALETLELPIGPYKIVKGMARLREYLKEHPKQVIKIDSSFRGDFETLKADSYDSVKLILDNRAPDLGIYADEIDFIVEDQLDCKCEAGFDGFFSGGEFTAFSYGIEYSKNLYIGKVSTEVPPVLMDTLDAFQPLFEKLDYRGLFSSENRIVSEKESYFIDACCRGPLPLGVLYGRFINNWADVVYKMGRNEPFEIECDHKYVGAFALTSGWAKDHFTLVEIDNGHEDDFRFLMATQDDKGNYYAVKGLDSAIVVVAGGKTPAEVVKKLKENAEHVHAFGLENDEIKGIDGILEQIEKGKAVGVNF